MRQTKTVISPPSIYVQLILSFKTALKCDFCRRAPHIQCVHFGKGKTQPMLLLPAAATAAAAAFTLLPSLVLFLHNFLAVQSIMEVSLSSAELACRYTDGNLSIEEIKGSAQVCTLNMYALIEGFWNCNRAVCVIKNRTSWAIMPMKTLVKRGFALCM